MYFCYNFKVTCMRVFFFFESHRTTLNLKPAEYVLHNKFQEERKATAFRRNHFEKLILFWSSQSFVTDNSAPTGQLFGKLITNILTKS